MGIAWAWDNANESADFLMDIKLGLLMLGDVIRLSSIFVNSRGVPGGSIIVFSSWCSLV